MKAPKKVKVTAGGEKHVVYKKTTKKGEGKVGHIMVNHPTKDKGQWDTIDLTAKGRAKTVAQGVEATKKWHKDNPDYKYKGKGMAKSSKQQAAIAISMKKAGKKPALKKAQSGLSIGQGPNQTAAKSNIGPKIAAGVATAVGTVGAAITAAKAKKAKKAAEKAKEELKKEVAEKGRYGGAKKSLPKAQVGKQVSDSVFNKKYNPDSGFFKSPPKDWKPRDMDPGFNKGPKGNYTPKKPKISKDGYLQYKKGGSIDILFFKKLTSKKKRVNDPGFAAKSSGYKGKAFKKGGSTPAWTRKEGKNPTGGLNAKGVASYRADNPGSKLQTAVTTKPSKLKAGSKDAKRRKSFCARMSGMPGPMKDEKGRPTRKALSLRKWNC